ncbi:ATP phosphoribosyltransferase regulatory subunit [Stagnimonas aquatica]|uniref:ATP phosphoribosyltransferase regulatory subunit n=1 Tax=Stagnimonas aquatica TaxID=2689987 RepID=A0A3N0V5L3_9GAMM|nr:ATP phosphoribosyltransferase regulatory subunit [Stagnimonas aquatica]ROH87864.1 ATP phosphoribosyltransferase regulatory subunit [Stagnimonas aquatica]
MTKLWMLPDGMEEALPQQAWRAEGLRRALLDHYRAAGYELILPPFLEHLDSLLTGAGADLDSLTFKLTDPASGRLLGLRSDMTPQAARIAARHFADTPVVRLCYLGTVLRTRPDALGGPRSPRQVGCELFGMPAGGGAAGADLEVLSLMLDTLRLAGVADVHLDLGHVGVYRAVVDRLALSAEDETTLFDILQRKSRPELSAFATALGIDAEAAVALQALTGLHGDVSVLQSAAATLSGYGDSVVLALRTLEQVIAAIARQHPGLPIHLDLAELRGARYHTGLTFAAFAPGHGRELARGGRYDGVGGEFGMARPATGFSADVNELLRLGAA